VRELYRPQALNRLARLQVTVERFTEPAPLTVVHDGHEEQHVVTEVRLLDAQRSGITSVPIADTGLVTRLDDLRLTGRVFEVLGLVTDVPIAGNLGRAFRLVVLEARPLVSHLQRLRATADEVAEADALLERLRAAGRSPFDYVREQVCEKLGIIEIESDETFGRAIDTTIVAAFSCGTVGSTPGNLHHVVVGPSGIGKKLLAQIARALHPVHTEIGVTKITEAGLSGTAHRKDGIWTHTPGLLPRAHGGVFVAEDIHELSLPVRRSLVGTLLKLMEDGRLIDSTAAATEYQVSASVHFDQNVSADVWDGDGDPRYSFASLQLPKHFLSRADFVTALPRDRVRQRRLACEVAGAPDRARLDDGWQRELRVLVTLLRDRFPEPSLTWASSAMREAVEELCRANSEDVHFDDFLIRIAVSLKKTVKAVCRSRALDIATQAEVGEATHLLRSKIEFLGRLEPGVSVPSSWPTKTVRQRHIQEQFAGQEVTVEDVREHCTERGAAVDCRTVRRDLSELGGRLVGKGRWLLPAMHLGQAARLVDTAAVSSSGPR
jgi:hypothetical protein